MFGRKKRTAPQQKSKPKPKLASKASRATQPKLSLLTLESRLMFDAAAAATAAEVNQEQVAQEQAESALSNDNTSGSESQASDESQELLQAIATYSPGDTPTEIAFVDPTVPDYQSLIAGMGSNVQIVMLDGGQDGMEQIAASLAGRTDIDAIHIISHGAEGQLSLGTGTLTQAAMTGQYADELAAIKQALAEQADILIYGCDFAEGQTGQDAVTLLSQLTGADVAASTDATGYAEFGGDWVLETQTGTIETTLAVTGEVQVNWKGLLAETWMDAATGTVIAGPVGNDWYVGDSANNTPVSSAGGNDIMYGAGGDDTLTSGSGNDILVGGDGNDTISGGSDDDVILGGTGNDYLDGGSAVGKNTIIGGGGSDQMVGGSGADVFRFTGAQSGDVYTVNGNGATDIIDLSEFSTATITNSGGVITVDRGGGDVFTINHSNVETVITAATVGNHGPLADAGVDQNVYTNSAVTLTAAGSSDRDGNTLTYQWTQIEGPKVTLSSSTAASPTFTAPSSATTLQFIVVVSDGTTSHADTVTITVSAAGLTASGGETRVNTTTTGTQTHNSLNDAYTPDSVAMDASGNYVSVWESAGNIYGQRYNSAGTAQGSEFIIASNAANERLASVDMNASGQFVVTWERDQGTGDYDIYARLYNSSGTAVTSEFLVNDTTTYDQEHAHVAMAADGTFVVVFESNIEASGTYYDNIYAQRYDATGTKLGSNFVVNTTTSGDQQDADLAMDSAGNFVVVWAGERTAGGGTYSIYGQRYNSSGVAQGSEFLVNSVASTNDQHASVAMNDSGNFVVTWDRQASSDADIQAQRFNSSGVAQGSAISITNTTSYFQEISNVAMDQSGNFVVSWSSNTQDGSNWGVYTRQYDSTGTALTTESRVNTTTTNSQDYSGVAYQDGKVVVTWSGNGPGDSSGIFMQRYDAAGGNAAPTITSNGGGVTASISVAENTTSVTTVTATDADVGASLTYSISGGADAAKFTINSSTGALSFITAPNYESPTDSGGNNVYDVLVTVKDNNGGADSQSLSVTVTDVNETVTNTVPGAQSTNEDTAKVFSSGNGNQITIADADAGSNPIEVTLTVTNGTLTLVGTTGLTFTTGDGTTDSTMTFRGTVANINTALNGLSYNPTANYSGSATLTITSLDNTLVSLNIDANLQARYTFEGNANDVASGTAQNGTLTNGATIVTDGTRGQVLSLDGGNDFVDLSTHTADFAGYTQGTISGWIKSTGTFETIFSISDTADTGSYAALFLGASGYLTYEVRENGVLQLAVYKSDIAINDGNWHHVAVTIGPSGNSLYVDGVLATAGQLTYDAGSASTQRFFSSVSSLDSMAIGRNQDSSGGKWYTTGSLDDVRLYNRVLGATEVATLANDLNLDDIDTVSITVSAVNDAPVLADTALSLTVAEDAGAPSGAVGSLVSAFTGGITDVDSGASKGIAITGSNETNGTWYYTTNGGSTWNALGAVSEASARLLAADANTRLYFQPNANYNGTMANAITFRAWDQTSGTNGGTAVLAQTVADQFSAVAYNNNDGSVSWSTDWIESGDSGGATSGGFRVESGQLRVDQDTDGSNIYRQINLSGATSAQLTFTANNQAASAERYFIQVSGNGGSSWTTLKTYNSSNQGSVSESFDISAYVATNTRIRVVVDNGDGSGFITLDNVQITWTASSTTGGTTAFSSATDTIDVSVTSVNDAPINTVPGAQTVAVDTPLAISGLSVADVDGNLTSVQLSVSNGTLAVTLSGTVTVTGGASGSSTVTISGSQADLNTVLASLIYQGNSLYTGPDTLTVLSTEAGGLTDTDTVSITVSNNAPTNILPGPQTVAEDTPLAITGLSVTDADGNLNTVQLSVTHGTLSVTLSGGTTVSGGSNGSGTVTLSGTQAELNATLASLTYQGNLNFAGLDSLTITSTDSTGTADTDSLSITVTPVNDAPTAVNVAPTTVVENAANGTVIGTASTTDPDAGDTHTYQLTDNAGGRFAINSATGVITVADGSLLDYETATNHSVTVRVTDSGGLTYDETFTINLTDVNEAPTGADATITINEDTSHTLTTANFGFSDVDAGDSLSAVRIDTLPGSGSLTLSGVAVTAGQVITVVDITAGNLVFSPAADAYGTGYASLTFSVRDSGNLYDGGPKTLTFDVTAVNDAPVNTVPGAQTVAEDMPITITGLSVTDVDDNLTTVQLAVSNGTLWVSVAGGATISAGANDSGTLTLSGSQAQINAALATVTYEGLANFTGSDTLTVTSTDSNSGTDVDTVAITVTAVNDAPVLADTALSLTVAEDAGAPSGAVGSTISAFTGGITDVDSGASKGIAITGSDETNGTWYYTTNGGTTWTAIGSVSNTSALLLADNVNTRLYFAPSADYNGTSTAALTVRAWDQTSGTAGTKVSTASNGGTTAFSSAIDTIDVYVTAVNDAPVNTVPGAQTVAEEALLSISGLSVTDVDGNLSATQLSVANGTLNVSLVGGATISAGANGSGTLTLSGTEAQINAALATVTYQGALNFTGSDTVTMVSTDSAGTPLSDTDTVAITVTPVNDAPVLADTTLSLTVAEDAGAPSGTVGSTINTFMGGITDVDSGASKGIAITASDETNGIWYYTTNGGATWTAVGSVSNTSALLLADNANTRLYFSPSADYNGTSSAALTLRAWDQTTGTAGTKVSTASNGGTTAFSSATDTIDVTVTAVNDVPVNTVPGAQTVAEDMPLTLGGISVTDVDGNLSTVQVAVGNGTLSVTLSGTASISAGVNGSNTLTLSGTQADINAALATLTYQGAPNFNGSDTLTITSTDTNSGTDVDTVAITVTAVDDATVVTGGTSGTGLEDTTLTGTLTATDVEGLADGSVFTVSATASNGTASIDPATGLWSYTPNADFNGSDSFTVTITDDAGNTATQVISVTVTAVVDITDDSLTTNEDSAISANVLTGTNGATADTFEGTPILTGVTQGANGTVTFLANGTVTYTPNANFSGTDSFTYTITSGGVTETTTVTVTVTAMNDAPVMPGVFLGSTAEDTTKTWLVSDLAGFSSDVDSGALQGLAIEGVDNSNGTWEYTLDGTTWLAIGAVSPTNALLLPSDATSAFRFVPNPNWSGTTGLFQYKAWDQTSGTAGTYADASITGGTSAFSGMASSVLFVTAVNDAPTVAVNTGSTVAEGGTDIIDASELAVTDVEQSAAQLTYTIGTGPTSGRLELTTAPGVSATTFTQADITANRLVYVHDGSETMSDSFTFTVNDGAGGTLGATTMTLTITPVNDTPTITSNGGGATATLNVVENVSAVTIVTGADVDLPAQAITYNISGGADQARFTINTATGALTFAAPPDFEAATDANGDNVYVVQVEIFDSQGASTTQTIQVTVTDAVEGLPPTPTTPLIPPVLLPTTPPSPPGPGPVSSGPSHPSSPVESPTEALPPPSGLPGARATPTGFPPTPAVQFLSDAGADRTGARLPDEPKRLIDIDRDQSGFIIPDEAGRPLFTVLPVVPAPVLEPEPPKERRAVSELLLAKLDEMAVSLEHTIGVSEDQHVLVTRIAALTGTTLSVGFIAWALRSGALLASFMATMPAWRHFDPLPVMGASHRDRERRRKEAERDRQAEASEFKGLKALFDRDPPVNPKP